MTAEVTLENHESVTRIWVKRWRNEMSDIALNCHSETRGRTLQRSKV